MPISPRYCGQCGVPQAGNAVFCASCGNRLKATVATPQMQVSKPMQPLPPQMPASPQNWQVVIGDELPVFAPPLRSDPTLAPSLRSSVVWTAVVTSVELAAAYAAGNPAALATANYRATLAGVSLFMGLIAGRRRGVASLIVLLGSLGLALFEGMTLWGFVQQILASPQLLQGLLPMAVPQAVTAITSLSTACLALRRS